MAHEPRRSQRVSGTCSIRALSNYQAEDLDVRYWHKADMLNALKCPLLGAKRTLTPTAADQSRFMA
jgi:hypothetical protein